MKKEENDINEGFWVFVSHSTKDFEKVRFVQKILKPLCMP